MSLTISSVKNKFFLTTLYLFRMDETCQRYPVPHGVSLHRLAEDDIDIVTEVHRNREIVRQRFEQGDGAYWLAYNGTCVNIQWYSLKEYHVWDIRSLVSFPQGSSYLYDGYTDPTYRGKGLNKIALSNLIVDEGLLNHGSMYSLTQKSNPMGWGFLKKFGFFRAAEISLLQVPPFRIYRIKRDNTTGHHVRLMHHMHTRPIKLHLDTVKMTG